MSTDRRPLILIDIDGVLKPETGPGDASDGWKQAQIKVNDHVIGEVSFKPEHGVWLRELAEETGAELAWGTRWNGNADPIYGTLLGINDLRFAPTTPTRLKPYNVVPWTEGRPFVWFDDEPVNARLTDRIARDQPHLVALTEPAIGLTEERIAVARDWLKGLAQ